MLLIPYIIFNGNCEEALNFYAAALGGEVKDVSYYEGSPVEDRVNDKSKVMNGSMVAKSVHIMASDSGQGGGQTADSGMVHLSLSFDSLAEQEEVYKALGVEGNITMPLQDTFWGARFGMLADKFGVNWMLNYDKKS